MPKRRRSSFLLGDQEPDMIISVCGSQDPLSAHYDLLRLYSEVIRDLPRNDNGTATTWDLRILTLEGEAHPVAAGTVIDWLDMIYAHVDTARRRRSFANLEDAKPLLLFADATGTCDVVMKEICDGLTIKPDLRFDVTLDDFLVEIMLKGRLYRGNAVEGLNYADTIGSPCIFNALSCSEFESYGTIVTTQIASQLEAWLYLAGRLNLVSLVRLLLDFIKMQLLVGADSILAMKVGEVYSPRVLEHMPREVMYESFLRDNLLCRVNDVQLHSNSGVTARTVTTEACMALQLEAALNNSRIRIGNEGRNMQLRHSAHRSTLVLGSQSMSVNVSVGGLSEKRCKRILRTALQKALANEQ